MNKIKHILWVVLMMIVTEVGYGQVGNYVKLRDQALKSPIGYGNLSIVDGKLFCHSGGLMLSANERNGQLISLEVDVDIMNIDENINYVVRHPITKHLFYTKPNRKGKSYLFEYSTEGKRPTTKFVIVGGLQTSVEHPVFSKDGKLMIFESDDVVGFGGKDLWYSVYSEGKWQAPQNMGHLINTPGDEMNPCIYGDFLLYASKNSPDVAGGANLYATRLLSIQTGDTVKMLPIGEAEVQLMPAPFNSVYDDVEMVADEVSDKGYWVMCKDSVWYLNEFFGSLIGAELSGCVTNKDGKPVVDADVVLMQGDKECGMTSTDDYGNYKIYMKAGENYQMCVKKSGYFRTEVAVNPKRIDENKMMSTAVQDVQLDRLEMSKAYDLGNVFGPNADVEISSKGMALVDRVVQFLKDNPFLKAEWHVWSDAVENDDFNVMVTNQRLSVLRAYLTSHGIDELRIKMVNTNETNAIIGTGKGDALCKVLIVENL